MTSTLESQQQPGVVHADTHALQSKFANYEELVRDAAKADAVEHQQTFKEAFAIHKKAVFWSMALSAALIMEGYDVVVVASFYGQPNFLRRFGEVAPDGSLAISAMWQTALGDGQSAGAILGLLLNGWAQDVIGPQWTMFISLIALAAFIFISVFANSLGQLCAAAVLCGVAWGVFQTLTTAYASEVCPIALRHYLTAYINMCWGIGIFLSSGVVRATLEINSDWSWRLPFVIQWVWIPFLLVITYFCPTSPYWLVRKGRVAEAEKVVRRLTNPALFSEVDVKRTVAMIEYTNELEKQEQAGTSYIDCFRGVDRRRTEIAMMTFAIQLLSGQNLIGQGVQFFERAGLGSTAAFDINLALNSMFIIGTVASWFLLARFGRRTLYIAGLVMMDIVMITMGGLAFSKSNGASWAIGALLVALNFAYNATLGPICYTIIAEVGSTRLRAKTVVLARCAYQIMNIICGIIVPRQLSATAWNWGAKSAFFWFGSCSLCIIYCYFRLPETRGRSYGELEVLFEKRIPAWRFASTKVDQFNLHDSHDKSPSVEKADVKEDEMVEKN